MGAGGAADWLTTEWGIFVASLATIALATYLVAVGMKAYANFQKWALWIGLAGLAVGAILLIVTSKDTFIASFNREMLSQFGAKDAYAATIKGAGEGMPSSMFAGSLKETFKLLPVMAFWLLWPVWGATLYGEVRGAKDFRKNIYQMAGGLLAAVAIVIVFLFLVTKTMGWDFFEASANGYMGVLYAYIDPAAVPGAGEYLSPTAMTAWIVNNSVFQVIFIAAISLIVFGWWGTVFLSSTRMIFASAFDRILPESVAKVTSGGVPVNALLLMAIPSVIVSAFYAFSPTFVQLTYDATLVIAIMFFVTGLAFVFMPIRAKAIWQNSALPKGPILPIVGIIYVLFMGGMLIAWFYDKLNVYGVGYKNKNSMIFMAILYVAAIVIWVIAYFVRKRQGMELEAVAKEIPVE